MLSGTVKTASAGLFTIFFGFGIIVFVLATLNAKAASAHLTQAQRKSRTKHITFAFWGLLASFLLTATLGALGHGAGFGGAAFFLGAMLALTGIAYVVQLDYD